MVYVGFWVGVPFASLLFGDVFRLLSPWRAIGRGVGWVAQPRGRAARAADYPERLGRWPAAAGPVRVRDLRAVLGQGRRARPAGAADARLPRGHARGDEPLRRRAVGAQRRRVRRPLQPARPRWRRSGATTDGRLLAARALQRRGQARADRRGRSRCWSPRSARPRSTAPARARCSTTSPRTCSASSATSGSRSRSRSSSASSSGWRWRWRSWARSRRSACAGMKPTRQGADAA